VGRFVGISLLVAAGGAVAGCGGVKTRGSSGGGDRGCLPAVGAASMRLVTVDGRTHICSERNVADGGAAHHACWVVDLASGAVRQSDVVMEPGRARVVPAAWTDDGLCAEGYCVTADAGDETEPETETTVQLAIGANVAVMLSPAGMTLFDGARTRKVAPGGADGDVGPSAAASDPLVVDDVVFVGDFDAGPHADMHVYAADGRYLGPVTDPADVEEYSGDFELWNGSVSVLGAHEVAFAEHLLQRVLLFDTRARKVVKVWRRQYVTPELCTQEQVDIYFDPVEVNLEFAMEEGRVTPSCKLTLDDHEGRFGPYGLARNADGALVALARSGDTLVLVTFDDAGQIVKDVPLGVCDPAPQAR
jgi:hypothetical protein